MGDFIKLTGKFSGKPIYVRIGAIVCVAAAETIGAVPDGGTAICFPGSEEDIIYVAESPDAVMKMIAKKTKEEK